MATLHITTTANSSLNRVRIFLYKATDPLTVIQNQYQDAPHPVTIWTFEDLMPGDVYKWVHVEVDGSENVITTYNTIEFTVPDTGSIQYKEPEDVRVGGTTGTTASTNTFTFDGTGGKPDWRLWKIIPFELGTGPMEYGVQYTWNKDTGLFTRLDRNLIMDERMPVEFEPKIIPASNTIVVRDAWSENLIITDDTILNSGDFNKNAVIKGADSSLVITLPDIFTVVPNRLLYVDSTEGNHLCAEIKCSSATGNGNLFKWPQPGRNSIYICNCETLAIYREKVDNSTSFWRVKFAEGNFKTVGEFVSEYATLDDTINKVAADATLYDVLEYARLYDYVQRLSSSQVVTFAEWSSTLVPENKYKFSHANTEGKFHVPDIRDLYDRASGANAAGFYMPGMVGPHVHGIPVWQDKEALGFGFKILDTARRLEDFDQEARQTKIHITDLGTGTETRPNSFVSNRYIRC